MRKRENLWEKLPYSEGDLCSYGGFGGHDIQDKKTTLKVRLGEGDIREEGS